MHVVWVKLAVPAVKEQGEEVLKEADLLLREVRRVMEFLFFLLRSLFSVEKSSGVLIVHSSFL